jgi:hypothetical protein
MPRPPTPANSLLHSAAHLWCHPGSVAGVWGSKQCHSWCIPVRVAFSHGAGPRPDPTARLVPGRRSCPRGIGPRRGNRDGGALGCGRANLYFLPRVRTHRIQNKSGRFAGTTTVCSRCPLAPRRSPCAFTPPRRTENAASTERRTSGSSRLQIHPSGLSMFGATTPSSSTEG